MSSLKTIYKFAFLQNMVADKFSNVFTNCINLLLCIQRSNR